MPNRELHSNHIIQCENSANHENLRISLEKQENNENHTSPCEN